MTDQKQETPYDATKRARPGKTRDSSSTSKEERDARESNLDKTIADSFPASDPPSSDPDPQGGS